MYVNNTNILLLIYNVYNWFKHVFIRKYLQIQGFHTYISKNVYNYEYSFGENKNKRTLIIYIDMLYYTQSKTSS